MQASKYASNLPAILAPLNETNGDAAPQNGNEQKEGARKKIYIYRTVDGDMVASETLLTAVLGEPSPIIDNKSPIPAQPTTRREPPFHALILLIFCLFLFLDSLDTTITTLLTPTATITITPTSHTIILQSSLQLGKLLAALTVSQSLTVPTTGRGHQDARIATGSITFSNGQQNEYTVPAGTTFTARSGVSIVTTQSASIPAGNPGTGYGTATVPAQATRAGSAGNVPAGAINTTIAVAVFVRNNQFTNGQDSRDFQVVTRADLDTTAATLKTKVTASMSAALHGQLAPGEQLSPTPCTPSVSADHRIGDEATNLTVTVSETCTAIVYNETSLQQQASQLLFTQEQKLLTSDYRPYGAITVSVTKALAKANSVFLSFTAMGTWLYQINTERLTMLVVGKPRAQAVSLLLHLPGIQSAAITGIPDNALLSRDQEHIKFVEIVSV